MIVNSASAGTDRVDISGQIRREQFCVAFHGPALFPCFIINGEKFQNSNGLHEATSCPIPIAKVELKNFQIHSQTVMTLVRHL